MIHPRLCPDCLSEPAADQRAATQNGRGRMCLGAIARAKRRRKPAVPAEPADTPKSRY